MLTTFVKVCTALGLILGPVYNCTSRPAPARSGPGLVSLHPAITESIAFLNMGESLRGITRWCSRPRQLTDSLPRVGSIINPDLEKIITLQPDWVIVLKNINQPADVDALQQSGLTRLLVLETNTIDKLFTSLETLLALQPNQTGRQRLDAARLRWQLFIEQNSGRLQGKRVYIDFNPYKPPYYSLGPGTVLDSIIGRLGGQTIGGRREYPSFSFPHVLNFNPDYIVVPLYRDSPAERENYTSFWRRYFDDIPIRFTQAANINQPSPYFLESLHEILP